MANLSTLITGQTPIGGATEKTYIQAPDAPGNLWLASNSGVSVALETTTNLLPEGTTKRTAIKIQRASGSDYVYTRFVLDKVDGSKKMKIQWAQAYSGLVGSYTLSVVAYTDAGYSVGAITLPVSVANIQAMTGIWSVTFDAPSAATHPYIEIRINAISGTSPLYLSGVLVGPGTSSPSSIISSPILYTPVYAGIGTPVESSIEYRRVGDRLHISGRFISGTPTATTASMSLPPGLSIGTIGGSFGGGFSVGKFIRTGSGAANFIKQGVILAGSGINSTVINFGWDDYTTAGNPHAGLAGNVLCPGSNYGIILPEFSVPIAEWVGSGTMLVSTGALVEYSSNSNTGNGNDTTSFAYGSNGSLVPTITASVGVIRADKTVQFQYPVQADDMLVVEIQNGGTGPWLAVGDTPNYDKFHSENANRIGVGIISSPSSTTVVVAFAHGGATGTGAYGAAGVSYPVSAGDRWRVRKCKQTAPVGIDTSGLTSSGGGSGYVISTQTANFAAENLNHYLVDTSAVPITATLPAGTNTFSIKFSDDAKTWSIRPLTIQPATGERIGNQAINESFICDVSGGAVQLSWDGLRWVVDANTISSTVSITTGNIVSEKNYVVRPDAAATDWISSNVSLVTVSTETSAGNLPENATKQTAIKFTRVSGTTGYVYTRFVLDSVDAFRKLKIQWNQKFAGATGDFTIAMFSFTSSDYTTGASSLPIQNEIVPGGFTGSFQTSFDSTNAPYIELRVIAAAGTTPLYLSGVVIGPGVIGQVPAKGVYEQSNSFTIIGSTTNPTPGTGSTFYRLTERDGEYAIIRFEYRQTSAGVAGSGIYYLPLPNGLTINYAKQAALAGNQTVLGHCGNGNIAATSPGAGVSLPARGIALNTGQYTNRIAVIFDTTTTQALTWDSTNANLNNAVVQLSLVVRVPIAEWAASGVNIGQNAQPEFAADDGTGDVFGPNGSLVPNVAAGTGQTIRDFTFSTPPSTTDLYLLEYNIGGFGWSDASVYPKVNGQSGYEFGVCGFWLNATTFRVAFGNGGISPLAGLGAGSTIPWSNRPTDRFRVRKASAGSSVGFGLASSTESGLVSSETKIDFLSNITGTLATSVGMHFANTGNICMLQVDAIGNRTSTAGPQAFFDVAAIPIEFLPSQSQDFIIRAVVAGASVAAQIALDITGRQLTMTTNPGGSAWTASPTNRWGSFTLFWIKA